MISDKKLDFWIENNLNVLVTGDYGVGKTAIVESGFKRHGLKYLYFSAGTMDPFVDLIGVPRERTEDIADSEGVMQKVTYLDLLRPLAFATDTVEAIFMDELNRAPEKVRNAVMEIIQFKSINGKKFNNLRFIWAAVNPEDDARTYDVERLDPAQKDRFHIHTSIDFKPDKKFFYDKYGEEKAKAAIEWWNTIPKDLQKLVSPRRLDYALEIQSLGGDLHDVLNSKTNVTKLIKLLSDGLAREKIVRLIDAGNLAEVERMLKNDNVYAEVEDWVLKNKDADKYRSTILSLIPHEKIIKVLTENKDSKPIFKSILDQFHTNKKIGDTIQTFLKTSKDKAIQAAIYDNLPSLKSTKVGTDPIEFKAIKNANDAYTTFLANTVSSDAWKAFDSKSNGTTLRAELIAKLQDTPHNLSAKDAQHVKKIVCGLIRHSHIDTIQRYKKELLGPLNHALKTLNEDFNIEYNKVEINKLIKSELEQHLWTPKKGS
jgi:MoxR-like ATPase